MRLAEFSKELAVRSGFGRTLQGLLLLFMGLTVLLSVSIAFRSSNVRTVIVPPTVSKSFWVEDAAVAPEYLEQMALFLAQLVYNVTPANAEFNTRMLLNYAAPSLYGALRQQGDASAKRLRADNATTLFSVRAVTHDPRGWRVALHGVLTTYINEKRVADAPKVYLFTFTYSGGRLYVTSIVETTERDPLGRARPAEPAA